MNLSGLSTQGQGRYWCYVKATSGIARRKTLRRGLLVVLVFTLVVVAFRFSMHLTIISHMVDKQRAVYADEREQAGPMVASVSGQPETGLPERASGYYETIEETIARLKRDVVVTGTVTGVPGEESAMFRIEGMPDRSFAINTQLMDGFIITEITSDHVVLKNQTGNESFVLNIK